MPRIALRINKLNAWASIGCFLILAFALWLENNYLLAPCPLCMLQRLILSVIALAFLCRSFFEHLLLKILTLLCAIVGIILSSRQVWLQYHASNEIHSCGAGLMQLIHKYPLLDFIKIIFKGHSECSQIDYTIAGLSLAAWSLMLFSFILLLTVRNLKN